MKEKKFINTVTVSGVDDSVTPQDLIKIAEEYPFVEFGILLSKSAMGKHPRYPSEKWLKQLIAECRGLDMQFSGHLCGAWAHNNLKGKWPKWDLLEIDMHFPDFFTRFQLNIAGATKWDAYSMSFTLRELAHLGKATILQFGANTDKLLNDLLNEDIYRNYTDILFDSSGGKGILPTEWHLPLDGFSCGYAGGLGPDNIKEKISEIALVSQNQSVWIDAETKLRTDNGVNFDLIKAKEFLESAKPFVCSKPIRQELPKILYYKNLD